MARILLIEDDSTIADGIVLGLKRAQPMMTTNITSQLCLKFLVCHTKLKLK